MKQKPIKIIIDESKTDKEEKIKPFKVDATQPLNIDNDFADETSFSIEKNNVGRIGRGISFLKSLTGIVVALVLFIFLTILSDVTSTFEELVSAGSIGGYIYFVGLLLLLFVISLHVFSSLKQLKSIKNVQKIKTKLMAQKENPTQEIVVLAHTLLQQYEKIDDPQIKQSIKIMKDNINNSQVYSEIYKNLDQQLLPMVDKKAQLLIRNASIEVALSTAISPVAIFDMILIVWKSILLTKDIAKLYGFKPGGLTTIILLKQGLFNVAFAGITELATEMTNEITGTSILSKTSKSIGQGIANGVLLARLGYGIIQSCRPIELKKKRKNFISLIIKSIADSLGNKNE